ncbi:MAG: hypothetical protein GEU93_17280, partial [Propionibacteriales bacterium]|nr:hypothetical protein [Propionibacteriales bacterium]
MTKVLNPEYEHLEQLRSQVAREAPAVATALDEANRRMQSGRTWVGPSAAPAWAAGLGGRRRRLGTLIDSVI